VLSFSVQDYNLQQAFVVVSGSTYCQFGDGLAFMYVPEQAHTSPVIQGHLDALDADRSVQRMYTRSADNWHASFDGYGYDPATHYRAARVVEFFEQQGLNQELLHDVNQYQLDLLIREFQELDVNPEIIKLTTSEEYFGGYLSFETPYAQQLCEALRDIGVHTDYSELWLRMGPAPYLNDEQLTDAMLAMSEVLEAYR
jgi:kynureninase